MPVLSSGMELAQLIGVWGIAMVIAARSVTCTDDCDHLCEGEMQHNAHPHASRV